MYVYLQGSKATSTKQVMLKGVFKFQSIKIWAAPNQDGVT